MALRTDIPIGTYLPDEGGYLGGYISHEQDGIPTHALIISQNIVGDTYESEKGSLTQGFPGSGVASSIFDGKKNTEEILASGVSYEAVTYIENNLNANSVRGQSDWYLPSRAELDILFWNLKHENWNNNTADQYANPWAIPPRGLDRTLTVPGQTDVDAFNNDVQSAGIENLLDGNYWTSTRNEAGTGSFSQAMNIQSTGGQHFQTSGTLFLLIRAIRRVEALRGPIDDEELFQANYADASAADPKATALIQPTDVQRSIDTDVFNLKDGPSLHVVEAIFGLGELDNLEPYNPATQRARVYFVRDDQPGLREGKNLLLKGYQIRDADPSVPVTCTFWSPS